MAEAFRHGDVLVCTVATPNLTVGKSYVVVWNRRPDINSPTVVNDAGRPTQYGRYRFMPATELNEVMAAARRDINDVPGFRD